MKKTIFLLIDYRNTFYSSTKEVAGSMDFLAIKSLFEFLGYVVFIEKFSEVDFMSSKYKNSFVLYQSSEDPELSYKDYIEDILLGLQLAGAILIPDFSRFRAHHNKVFMEILRDISSFNPIQNIQTKKFGVLEEFKEQAENEPVVLKQSAGSRSRGVFFSQSKKKSTFSAGLISYTFSLINLRRFLGGLISGKGYKPISNFRKKFITQNFISGLSFDYKVLVYDNKYYVLKRRNRNNDFRASGSGLLEFVKEPPTELLDYAKAVFKFFNVPFASFDIANKQNEFYLLEFQFVSFGQYALEKSSLFFTEDKDCWKKVFEKPNLEKTFTYAVHNYISNKK